MKNEYIFFTSWWDMWEMTYRWDSIGDIFDNCLIILRYFNQLQGQNPFRFNNQQLTRGDFAQLIYTNWNSSSFSSSKVFILKEKLKSLIRSQKFGLRISQMTMATADLSSFLRIKVVQCFQRSKSKVIQTLVLPCLYKKQEQTDRNPLG